MNALARHPERLTAQHERLRKVRGDILEAESLSGAMAGQNAVCCAIGVRTPWEQPGVFAKRTERLLQAGVSAGRISRADVAHFILEELPANRYLRQTPLLTY